MPRSCPRYLAPLKFQSQKSHRHFLAIWGMDEDVSKALAAIEARFDTLTDAITQASVSERASDEATSARLDRLERGMTNVLDGISAMRKGQDAMRKGQDAMRKEIIELNAKIGNLETGLQKALRETVRAELPGIRGAMHRREK